MLNSTEHEFQVLIKINLWKSKIFLVLKSSDAVFILLINVKMPIIVGILTFMSRINFMLSLVEHEKSFIALRPWKATILNVPKIWELLTFEPGHGFVMPPTLKKFRGHIALGGSICPYKKIKLGFLHFIDWFLLKNNWPIFFLVWIISLCGVFPLLKVHNDIL